MMTRQILTTVAISVVIIFLTVGDSSAFDLSGIPLPGAEIPFGLDLRRLHKYSGYGTLLLAGMAAVSSSNRSMHYGCAYSAAGAALVTCLTGYLEYRNIFNMGRGLFADENIHIILGVVGTIGLAASVAMADSGEETSHSSIGGAGAASMLISVVVIRW